MPRALKVFVSCPLDELADERIAIKQALQSLPLSVDWDFSFTAASSGKPSTDYLETIWNADLYILLLGERVSEPVEHEYRTALQAEKPVIALIKEMPRAKEAATFIRGLKGKPRPRYFQTVDGAAYMVQAGVSDELIKEFRRLRLDEAEMREVAKLRVESMARERQASRDWKSSAAMMGALLIIVIIAVAFGRGHNSPPVIDNVLANPERVTVNGTADVRVFAHDPEQGALTYDWQSSAGSLEPSGSSESPNVTFRAPNTPGQVQIKVTVRDQLGLEVDKTIDLAIDNK
jgi:hypothetical protein